MLYNFSRPTIETINKYAEYGEVYISPSYYINQSNHLITKPTLNAALFFIFRFQWTTSV